MSFIIGDDVTFEILNRENILSKLKSLGIQIMRSASIDESVSASLNQNKPKFKYQPATREALKKLCDNLSVNLGDIDTSRITDMFELFKNSDRTDFSGIERWDVSNVTNMSYMFEQSKFNGDISNWNVTKVNNMCYMFKNCSFCGDISNWDVSNVEKNVGMFFNSPLTSDKVSVIFKDLVLPPKSQDGMYHPETKDELKRICNFSKVNLGDIDTSKITDMSRLFEKYSDDRIDSRNDFSGIETWDVSNVIDMSGMFAFSEFNGDISNWDVSNVENMHRMFAGSKFNGDISNWNVSNVKDMSDMFYKSDFNGDINNWDVSNVSDMSYMFRDSSFNGDISQWDVSNVENMSSMFAYSLFNGDISNWDVSNVKSVDSYMFRACSITADKVPEKFKSLVQQEQQEVKKVRSR